MAMLAFMPFGLSWFCQIAIMALPYTYLSFCLLINISYSPSLAFGGAFLLEDLFSIARHSSDVHKDEIINGFDHMP